MSDGLSAGGSTIANSNIGATVKVSNIENFDLQNSFYPIVVAICIIGVYILGALFLSKKDRLVKTITQIAREENVSSNDFGQDIESNSGNELVNDQEHEQQPEVNHQLGPQLVRESTTDLLKKAATKEKFKHLYFEKHLLLGICVKGNDRITRVERWTIFICILVSDLFITGLFYDNDRNPEDEEKESNESAESTVEGYSWKDFWIMIYSILFTVPIPIILVFLFKRSKLKTDLPREKIKKTLKMQKIKRMIGYSIAYLWIGWCLYSTFMFSLEFGNNTTQVWMLNFGYSTVIEILIKDALVAMCVSAIFVIIILFKLSVKRRVANQE